MIVLAIVGLWAAPAAAAPNVVSDDASWIQSAQLPDGAITHYVDHVQVWPYLSNFAAMGLARASVSTGNAAYAAAAWKWLAWYQSHEDANGFVTDYNVNGAGVESSTGDMDSTDAYAGTYLLAARFTWKATGNTAQLKTLANGISGAVKAIEATQDSDGLTWAKPAWHVKYLMDQAETYAGLRAGAEIAKAIGNTTLQNQASNDADRMAAGVAALWNASTNSYDWAVHDTGVHTTTNPAVFYPDGLQQVWAVAFGLADPTRSAALMQTFDTRFPRWDSPTAKVQYDTGSQAVSYRAVVGWAEMRIGKAQRASTGGSNIRAAAIAANRAWPFTPGDAGQLVLLESAATGILAAPVSAAAAPAPAAPAPAPRMALAAEVKPVRSTTAAATASTSASRSGAWLLGAVVLLMSMSIAAPISRRVRHGVVRSGASRYSPVNTRK